MHQEIFTILPRETVDPAGEDYVSFQPFIDFLDKKEETENTLRSKWYTFIRQFFTDHPDASQPVALKDLSRHGELLDLMYTCLFPSLSDERELLWALSAPNSDTIFFSTEAFYRKMSPANPDGMYARASVTEKEAFRGSLRQVKYALVLERIHHVQPAVKDEIVYAWTDRNTNLKKYYSIMVDTRFMEVTAPHPEPAMNGSGIACIAKKAKHLCEMETEINLDEYHFSGFSIVRARDVTHRYSLHKMRSAVLRHIPNDYQGTYGTILSLLKTLCGNPGLRFGLLPLLKLNEHPVSLYDTFDHSLLVSTARREAVSEKDFHAWIESFFQHPRALFFQEGDVSEDDPDIKLCRAFFAGGAKAFALLPVYYHEELAGLLEVSSEDSGIVNQYVLQGLESALPILSQLLHTNQLEFRSAIDTMIKTHFTAIQPAVQWRFNEVAWRFIKNQAQQGLATQVEPIRFEDVYPLYGAVDIRNSTIERNAALYKDLLRHFFLLRETLEDIYPLDPQAVNDLLSEARALEPQTESLLSEHDESVLNKFLDTANRYLRQFQERFPSEAIRVATYLAFLDPVTGLVHDHRQALETSMQLINRSISLRLEQMQTELETKYPAYFEKFRTDGLEYDIYFGRSINPAIGYDPQQLSALRMLQLRSMADIIRLVQSLEPGMPVRLQTTQLIYVNAYPIDISFRMDEKRFDAEGGYNIRYHIIKKRIDKVRIRDTNERLTVPGKIAIVYSRKGDEDVFCAHIEQLQAEGLLDREVETLELEELQGVTGLKALRVTVIS